MIFSFNLPTSQGRICYFSFYTSNNNFYSYIFAFCINSLTFDSSQVMALYNLIFRTVSQFYTWEGTGSSFFCSRPSSQLMKFIYLILFFRKLFFTLAKAIYSFPLKKLKIILEYLIGKAQKVYLRNKYIKKQMGNQIKKSQDKMMTRYKATMLLAAVGDAMGYRKGQWQFNKNGQVIHKDMMKLTKGKGIQGIIINKPSFPYSDDTVMHIATAKALLESSSKEYEINYICQIMARQYKECMKQMGGRAPGMTCIRNTNRLNKDGNNWKDIGFQKNAGGCGAAMRAACIGLFYHQEKDTEKLMQISIESGRITHHNPIGYLGSFVAALFTSYAIRTIHPRQWLYLMHKQMRKAKQYVSQGRQGRQNIESGDWDIFQESWKKYEQYRKMENGSVNKPFFPEHYDVKDRQEFYQKIALSNWPGALGVDSVIIAYDALLSTLQYCDKYPNANKWEQLCLRAVLHGGDNDSTGTIAGAWYGAYYGIEGVYDNNYKDCEERAKLEKLGEQIYQKAYLAKL